MARIARKNFDTSFFHVMVQGINREFIFNSSNMKKEYLNLLKKFNEKMDIQIIAYCIMDNHAHLLLYTNDVGTMSKYMNKVNTSYAIYYNTNNKNRVGYVFRDRYKTQPIFKEEQLYKCINYIHKNPVKAKMVTECEEYQYSSYRNYQRKQIPIILKEVGMYNVEEMQFIEDSEEFLDVEINKKEIIEERMNKFAKKYGNIEDIRKNRVLLKKLVKYLKEGYQIKYTDIMEYLNLTKGQVERLKR